MRIVLVNWARIWDGAGFGGGVNGYCQSLALELVKRGHDVVSLFGGTTFVPEQAAPNGGAGPFIRRHHDWLGVRVFEVINSPVMAPSIVQYQRPMDEVSAPALEREVERLFRLLQPDVVHFHNIEGFSAGCIEAARRAGVRTVFSLHNYHTICPQVYLMQGHRRVCHDSRRGHACVNCIKTKDPAAERRERAARYTPPPHPAEIASPMSASATPDVVGNRVTPSGREAAAQRLRDQYERTWGGFKHEFTWPVRVLKGARELLRLRREMRRVAGRGAGVWVDAPLELPGAEVRGVDDALRPFPVQATPQAKAALAARVSKDSQADPRLELLPRFRSDDQRGQTQAVMMEWDKLARLDEPEGTSDPLKAAERAPLLNVVAPEPACDLSPNEYGRRREAMVRMLSSCDRVLAVSNFVREKFVSMGVDPGVIRTMPIGSRINQIVRQGREMVFEPPPFREPAGAVETQRPVRLVFMGYNNYYKGLHILVKALESLTPQYLRRFDVSVYALDGHSVEWMFRRMEPRLAKLVFVHGYSYHDIPWMLGGKDLGVVPSVWWDNAPQTVFECFACGVPVLGAAVGGIPDFVIDGHNGLLFRGNDAGDLARRLREVADEPWRLTALRANVKPPKGIDEHAAELESLYGSIERPGGLSVEVATRGTGTPVTTA